MSHQFAVCLDTFRQGMPQPLRVDLMRGPWWLRAAVNRLLQWLRAEKVESVMVRSFVPPQGDLLQRLHLQQDDMDLIYNQKAKTLFVGPQALDGIHSELSRARAMSLGQVECRMGGREGLIVLGVEVVLVPWMKGVLLVPDIRKQGA